MEQLKLDFITTQFPKLIKEAAHNTTSKWGKMNLQQMIEHTTDFFKVSTGKIQLPLVTPIEHLSKYREFLLSDKEFKENTKAPANVLPEEPLPIRNESMAIAISKLEKQINNFVVYFKENEGEKTTHPVFGELNFEEWVLLHYKHVLHHAKQFGLL